MRLGRISWGWENDLVELYFDRKAWKEDCCDYEWFVLDHPDQIKMYANLDLEFGDCKNVKLYDQRHIAQADMLASQLWTLRSR